MCRDNASKITQIALALHLSPLSWELLVIMHALRATPSKRLLILSVWCHSCAWCSVIWLEWYNDIFGIKGQYASLNTPWFQCLHVLLLRLGKTIILYFPWKYMQQNSWNISPFDWENKKVHVLTLYWQHSYAVWELQLIPWIYWWVMIWIVVGTCHKGNVCSALWSV